MDFGVNFKIKKYRMLNFLFIGSVSITLKPKGWGWGTKGCMCVSGYLHLSQYILGCSPNHYFSFSPKEHEFF